MREHQMINRRTILKSISFVAVSSFLPNVAEAHEDTPFSNQKNSHKIISANIRVDLPEDEKGGVGWSVRRDITVKILKAHKPDIICLQEVLKGQNEDLKRMLPNFQSFGFEGPEMDPIPTGYHGIAKNPIMYLKSRYDLIASGTYWLSETPLIGGSKSWDTGRARHVNWLRLLDKKMGNQFRVINVHLDHLSQNAREKQITLLLKESSQYDNSFPQILAGDFNEDASNKVINMIKKQGWSDSYIHINGEGEPGFTGHAFKGKVNTSKKGKIDFIFTRGLITPLAASIIRDDVGDRYPSDHFFISANVIIPSR